MIECLEMYAFIISGAYKNVLAGRVKTEFTPKPQSMSGHGDNLKKEKKKKKRFPPEEQ